MNSAFRFGVLEGDRQIEHRHAGLWAREQTTGPGRLVLAPAGDFVDLLGKLVESMGGPFGLLHVLLVSRCGRESGRYQSSVPMPLAELRGFLESFAGYLEHDGRHHTWFFGLGDGQQVIYDNHNVVYCYGDLDRFQAIAAAAGLRPGTAQIPAPHVHMYNPTYDADEDRIFSELEWKHFPLRPEDDD